VVPHDHPPDTGSTLTVLCAQWCTSCEQLRTGFAALTRSGRYRSAFWLDIDTNAHLLPEDLDIPTLPMALVTSRDGQIVFFGPVRPDTHTLVLLGESLRPEVEHGASFLLATILLARLVAAHIHPQSLKIKEYS